MVEQHPETNVAGTPLLPNQGKAEANDHPSLLLLNLKKPSIKRKKATAPRFPRWKASRGCSLLDPLLQEGHDESQKLAVFMEVLFDYLGKCFVAIFEYCMSNCSVRFICSLCSYTNNKECTDKSSLAFATMVSYESCLCLTR